MRVLVTGGTGVVGRSAVTASLQRGHAVRLLSRNAVDVRNVEIRDSNSGYSLSASSPNATDNGRDWQCSPQPSR